MNEPRLARRLSAVLLALPLLLAACASAAPSAAPTADLTQAPPDETVTSPPQPGPTDDTGAGQGPPFTEPEPGQLDVHPVPIENLEATVDGSTVTVIATWTSGVAPCNVLDSIVVQRDPGTFTITLREGHGPGELMCVALAEQKRTRFDIPDVVPGTWVVIDSQGLAPQVEVVVA